MLRAISGYIGRHHVALLALFLALCGTSVAATNYINGKRIKPGSIPANRLAPTAAASLKASDLRQYCASVRARPRSNSDAPCRSRNEVVSGATALGGIALGTDGNPVIIYGNHPVNLIRCNDPICAGNNESVGDVNGTYCGAGNGVDVAIGLDGNPVVSQKNGGCASDGILNVAVCKDPACAASDESGHTFDADGSGAFSSIAIGTDGNPVVSYYDSPPEGDLKVLHCNDPVCDGTDDTLTVVASGGDVGLYTSLAIGRNGNPVIAYYDATNHDLKVARCNDIACAGSNEKISTVDSAADVGEFPSLAIGSDGNPVIAYYKRTTGHLRVARCNDPACTGGNEKLSTVAAVGDVGLFGSLGIGLDGRPVIAFYDGAQHSLKFARCNDPACTGGNENIATLDRNGDAGLNASLVMGVDGIPVIAYVGAGGIRVARPAIP